MRTIVLFTASYPYSIALESTFLEEELFYLNKHFKVIIIPQEKKGNRSKFVDELKNIEVWEDLEEFNKWYALSILDSDFLKELKHIKNSYHFKKLVVRYKRVKWLKKYIKKKFREHLFKNGFVYYTFWFGASTTALIELKDEYNFKLFSRVHGADLFFERNKGYIPFRKKDAEKIDKIIAVSKAGYDYLQNVYNLKKNKIKLLHLLSKDYKIVNPLNEEKTFKIVSCALVSPLKRIDKIIELLFTFSKKYKVEINYVHIGNGADFCKIKALADKYKSDLLKIKLLGLKTIDEIMKIYENISFDYFITLSKTEGGVPFALREAASCEIPLLGTRVGGIPEIIEDNRNGFLINEDLSNAEDILLKSYDIKTNNFERYINTRKESRKIFLKKYEATRNCEKFIKFLEEFCKNKTIY